MTGPGTSSAPAPLVEWEQYATAAAAAMRKLKSGEVSLSTCYRLLPSRLDTVSQDVHDFIEGIVSEVDNDQSGFDVLLAILEQGATEAQVIEFMNAPV
jgi:hypothetical protein